MDSDSAVTDAATLFGSSYCFAAAVAEEADSAEMDADANPFLKQNENEKHCPVGSSGRAEIFPAHGQGHEKEPYEIKKPELI